MLQDTSQLLVCINLNTYIMKTLRLFAVLLTLLVVCNSCYMFKKSTSYYGIELDDNKVVFLVDISGSMENKIERDAKGQIISSVTNKAVDAVSDQIGGAVGSMVGKTIKKQMTKLEKAKKKIIPVINGFTEESYFTIITFENDIRLWRKELVQATSANKKLAVVSVKALESGGGTNISDALEEAFHLAGAGVNDPEKELEVETVFLLSDGEPSAGKHTNTRDILEAVESWNPLKRVTIHTIGLGDNHDRDFMRQLAEDNGGTYIDK